METGRISCRNRLAERLSIILLLLLPGKYNAGGWDWKTKESWIEMVREIVHDPLILARKSEEAAAEDAPVAVDLMDTLMATLCRVMGTPSFTMGSFK